MNKVKIQRQIELDYGHTLPNHFAFCNQIHGHRAKVIAEVEGDIIQDKNSSSQGMVLDFKFMKKIMMEKIHDVLDHGFAVWAEDAQDLAFISKRNKKFVVTPEPPTAEYLAKWAYLQFVEGLEQEKLDNKITLNSLTWYETPNACAIYTLQNYNTDSLKEMSASNES